MANNYLAAARQYHDWGANVLANGTQKNPVHTWAGGKDGTGPNWVVNRQTIEDVVSFPWTRAAGVGIVNGLGGWHTFDIDAIKPEGQQPIVVGDDTINALLSALGLPLDYSWVWRGQSQAGWAVAFLCDDPMPLGVLPASKKDAGVAWGWPGKDSGADWHHLELRYTDCQTVYPPSARYQWRHEAPATPPASVPIHRVIAAFFALCPPAPHTLGSVDRSVIAHIRDSFDLAAYAESVLGGDIQRESGGELRLLGHGGLLINQDKGIWNAFGDEIGGDCFDLVAYAEYRTTARNLNGKSADVLRKAAAWAGVTIPERKPDNPLSTPSDRASDREVIAPRFTIATEEKLAELPPVRYLDRELGLVAKAFHLIYGASGSGKTFFAIERAMRQVTLGRRVLYIPTEDVQGLRYRVTAWRRAHPGAAGRLSFLEMPEGLDLQDYNQVAELIEAVEPYQYDHIILDTLREAHSGDENSSQDTRRINRAIQRLVVTGAAVDVVHHTGVNGERPRGSTALFGNADAVIKVEGDDGLVRISFDKLRNAPPRDALAFGMVQQETGLYDTDGEPVVSVILRPSSQVTQRDARITPTQRKVLQTLALSIFSEIGAKAQQVIDTTEISRRHAYLALAALKTRGFASQGDKGDPYYITPAGRAQLGPDFTPVASDLPNNASARVSDRSDPPVITSDHNAPDSVVIHSDHTRRVITGSHIDHKVDHTQTAADWEEELRAALPVPHGPSPAQLVAEYERVIGPLTETLTSEELEAAIAAAESELF